MRIRCDVQSVEQEKCWPMKTDYEAREHRFNAIDNFNEIMCWTFSQDEQPAITHF